MCQKQKKVTTPYKLGWKVVDTRWENSFVKIYRSSHRTTVGGGETLYRHGMRTVPNVGCGPLCVFTNLQDAVNFTKTWSGRKIFPCAYIPSKAKYAYYKNYTTSIEKMPKGKALADEVILLGKLNQEESK